MKNVMHVLRYSFAFALCALAFSNQSFADDIRYKTLSKSRGAIANYHEVYSEIVYTRMIIQDFTLKTSEGKTLQISTPQTQINLQDLMGPTKGIRLQLGNVVFPGRAQSINVVEIEAKIVKCIGTIGFRDGSTCKMGTPQVLTLYTGTPVALENEDYLIKVGLVTADNINMTVLNAIQFDMLTKTVQKYSCTFNHMNLDASRPSEECRAVGKPSKTTSLSCSMVNRRYPIARIVIRANDA